jgi:bacterioferritin-associated ferredoxin
LRLNHGMYVCICKAVTDREIRKAAASGADNLYELRESLGVASGCGGCADHAQEILDESSARRRGPTTYIPTPA